MVREIGEMELGRIAGGSVGDGPVVGSDRGGDPHHVGLDHLGHGHRSNSQGTGTTLLACQELGVHGIGIELSEAYCVAANRRFAEGGC